MQNISKNCFKYVQKERLNSNQVRRHQGTMCRISYQRKVCHTHIFTKSNLGIILKAQLAYSFIPASNCSLVWIFKQMTLSRRILGPAEQVLRSFLALPNTQFSETWIREIMGSHFEVLIKIKRLQNFIKFKLNQLLRGSPAS